MPLPIFASSGCLLTVATGTAADTWRSNAIAGGGTISTATYNATQTFINTLTASGTLAKINLLWHFSGDYAASKYLLKYPSGHPGSVTYSGFSSSQYAETTGLNATGGTEYADLQYIPSTYQASNTAGSIAVYCHTASPGGTSVGVADTADNNMTFYLRFTDGNTYFDCYNASSARTSGVNASAQGLMIGNRTANNYAEVTKNGTIIATNTSTVSTTRPNLTPIAFGLNYSAAGTPNTKFTVAQRLSLIALGEGLTSDDVSTINSAYTTYAAEIGRTLP